MVDTNKTHGYDSPMSKKDIPEILELEEIDERDEAVLLLEKAATLKEQARLLTEEFDAAKERLMEIQLTHGLEGIRHNRIVFASIPIEGRTIVSVATMSEYLLAHGVPVGIIAEAKQAATTRGESGWRREIKVLD